MTKVCIFNKSNDALRFYIFKKFFQCVNSKISLTCCAETGAVYQNVLDSERRMANLTFRLTTMSAVAWLLPAPEATDDDEGSASHRS